LLMSPEEKSKKLLSHGLAAVIMHPFGQDLAEVPADQFVPFLKEKLPMVRTICVGKNFRFGKNRTGDSQNLISYGKSEEIDVKVAESLILDELPISSSRIRIALSTGDIEGVNQLLGRKYEVGGTVIPGKELGRNIGFPTLNLAWHPEAKPAFGVYAGWAKEEKSGQKIPAIANYGVRPTVNSNSEPVLPLLEIHCLEDPDLSIWQQGSCLSMGLGSMIRKEQKFADIEDLKFQIKQDCKAARKLFSQGL